MEVIDIYYLSVDDKWWR